MGYGIVPEAMSWSFHVLTKSNWHIVTRKLWEGREGHKYFKNVARSDLIMQPKNPKLVSGNNLAGKRM
eukprot:scaffold64288_cov31-Prasinocladus_malaysianus.AAC.1